MKFSLIVTSEHCDIFYVAHHCENLTLYYYIIIIRETKEQLERRETTERLAKTNSEMAIWQKS